MLCVLVASLVCADAARAQDKGLQSNHGSLKAVPVRQAVVVDGKLDEWDVSAEMFSYGVRRLRDRYSVRVAAMWDSDALDLGLKWRDPTPMINNDVIAVALPKKKLVLMLDAATGAPRGEVAVDQPGSLTILPDGAVLGVRSGGLFRIPVGAATAELLHAVDTPLAVAADSRGRVFLSDAERLNVARFSGVPLNVTGRLSQIGEPGGHVPGPWNSQRMGLPFAIAVEERDDGSSRLWVTENSLTPRRVSVWDADSGRLVRDYIGNTRYSASGGFLSDDLTGVGFVDGVKFQLDLAAGTYSPLEILGGSPPSSQGRHNVFTLGKGAGNFANPYHFVSAVSG
ncbi:MAG TPA: hypothetical protein PLV92_29120, partial [Pirellulaceae bacterium]|nr:hypothetical protein [Pirellulaceae bacterium]